MLYAIAHILRDSFPWLWDLIGFINSWLFGIRYGEKTKQIPLILNTYSHDSLKFGFQKLNKDNVRALVSMFNEQPEDAFEFFKPHRFDEKTLKNLAKDKSFLAYVVISAGDNHHAQCVGYFFLRSFFWGKAFRGYMTDYRWRGRGISKLMNQCADDICSLLDIPCYGSISPENQGSMKSAHIKILNTLANGDYYVQYLPKKD